MRSWIMRWGPAALIMAVIFVASATPGAELPSFGVWDLLIKKGGHMLGYALLAAAYFHGLNHGRGSTKLQLILAASLAIMFAISDEWHQQFTSGRSPSAEDVVIDAAGAGAGLALWHLIRARLFPKQRKKVSSEECESTVE